MEAGQGVLHLHVAGLGTWLDARQAGISLAAPTAHAKFLLTRPAGSPAGPDDLYLQVRSEPLTESDACWELVCRTEIWELWLDAEGRYVFVAPRQVPPRCVRVDHVFKNGEVFGDLASNNGNGHYPLLQGLEIVLMVNRLAGLGDLILHAAGASIDGEGYCFFGSSGAGKSTLAAQLARNPAVSVLGEDQTILRFIEGKFWIFGTPWHENPDLCAAAGAPLKKLFFLNRKNNREIQALSPFDGMSRLLQTAFVPYYRPAALPGILDRLALLVEHIPLFTLNYQIGSDVLKLVLEA